MAVNNFLGFWVGLIGSASATVIPKLDLAYQIWKTHNKNNKKTSLQLLGQKYGATNSIQVLYTIKCNCILNYGVYYKLYLHLNFLFYFMTRIYDVTFDLWIIIFIDFKRAQDFFPSTRFFDLSKWFLEKGRLISFNNQMHNKKISFTSSLFVLIFGQWMNFKSRMV